MSELAPSQRRVVWGAALLVAVTRVAMASRSLWDWDEALFAYGLRDFDIADHHPHPPGFPLFIALAKLVHLVAGSEFHALQAVTLAGAVALFPLMFAFARELRMPFVTSFASAALLAFFPNVWFYGGTAFSDVPSLALVLLACVLLLRGRGSGGAYLAGAFVLALAAGFRPQNLLVGLAPALMATWSRVRATRSVVQPLLAIAIGATTLLLAFGGAAMATGGWERYREAVVKHQAYIAATDSFRSAIRPSLLRLFDDFFIRPWRMPLLNILTGVLSAIGVIGALAGRRRPMALALLTFGPFCVLAWLMLDHNSASRFSIGWAPLIALAVADGAAIVSRGRAMAEGAIAAVLVAGMIVWTLPGLVLVHRTDSPPVQAINAIRASLPRDARLYVHGSMAPFTTLLLADRRLEYFPGETPPLWPDDRNLWLLREGTSGAPHAWQFTYPRQPLWNVARRRYFEVSLAPQCPGVRFGEGWYGVERFEIHGFRWMSARGVVHLPRATSERASLTLRCYFPLDAIDGSPNVTIALDGKVLDRFVATRAHVERTYAIESRGDHRLSIETDRVAGTKADPRALGMRLDAIVWPSRNDCPR